MAGRPTVDEALDERMPASDWTGWIVFGAGMLILGGAIHIIQGLTTLLDDKQATVTSEGLAVHIPFTALGWLHLVLGLLAVLVGVGAMRGNRVALVAAVVVAGISAIANVTFIAAYPIWSLVVIAFDIIVIYAIVVYGRDMKRVW
ncbi:MAG TPA: hypothetical protein VGP26_20145 [Actinophytocola sp.]|jgi:hypothetical protein|nr:hypothetical protein [Actinophytocola sp.]